MSKVAEKTSESERILRDRGLTQLYMLVRSGRVDREEAIKAVNDRENRIVIRLFRRVSQILDSISG